MLFGSSLSIIRREPTEAIIKFDNDCFSAARKVQMNSKEKQKTTATTKTEKVNDILNESARASWITSDNANAIKQTMLKLFAIQVNANEFNGHSIESFGLHFNYDFLKWKKWQNFSLLFFWCHFEVYRTKRATIWVKTNKIGEKKFRKKNVKKSSKCDWKWTNEIYIVTTKACQNVTKNTQPRIEAKSSRRCKMNRKHFIERNTRK